MSEREMHNADRELERILEANQARAISMELEREQQKQVRAKWRNIDRQNRERAVWLNVAKMLHAGSGAAGVLTLLALDQGSAFFIAYWAVATLAWISGDLCGKWKAEELA